MREHTAWVVLLVVVVMVMMVSMIITHIPCTHIPSIPRTHTHAHSTLFDRKNLQ